MARYLVPEIYYQSSMLASSATKIERFKSFTWANKTNNNANFTLRLPIDEYLPVEPIIGGYIRVQPGDTIMQIEKKERICESDGTLWYEISGRPNLVTDDQVREAQNNGKYYFYRYNGVNGVSLETRTKGTSSATISARDVLSSSIYGDNLGGFTETVLIDAGREAFSWSSTIVSPPKPVVTTVNLSVLVTSNYAMNDPVIGGQVVVQRERHDVLSAPSHSVFISDETISVTSGTKSGSNGRNDVKQSAYQWLANDTQTDVTVYGPYYQHFLYWNFTTPNYEDRRAAAVIRTRNVTLRTDAQMRALMASETTPGSVSGIAPQYRTTQVVGGHDGYKCNIKSKGDVGTRYKVDYFLGDTITVNDIRLGVVYSAVVSGATETIDTNGYSVDIELGTVGATVEQRLNRTI